MGNHLFIFLNKCYEYEKNDNKNKCTLIINDYKYAKVTNLVARFILDNLQDFLYQQNIMVFIVTMELCFFEGK